MNTTLFTILVYLFSRQLVHTGQTHQPVHAKHIAHEARLDLIHTDGRNACTLDLWDGIQAAVCHNTFDTHKIHWTSASICNRWCWSWLAINTKQHSFDWQETKCTWSRVFFGKFYENQNAQCQFTRNCLWCCMKIESFVF